MRPAAWKCIISSAAARGLPVWLGGAAVFCCVVGQLAGASVAGMVRHGSLACRPRRVYRGCATGLPCGDGSLSPRRPGCRNLRDKQRRVVLRLALLVWMTAYLGLLPSFLLQLRWLDADATMPARCARRWPWPFSCPSAAISARTSPAGCWAGTRWRRCSVPRRPGRG